MALVTSHHPKDICRTEPNENGMNVFFRFIDGKTFCLWMQPTMSVAVMKQAVIDHQRATGSAASTLIVKGDLFFVYNGKPLSDDMLLADYGVTKAQQPVIWVNQRLPGGCFIISFSILCIIGLSIIGSFCTCGLSLWIVPLLLPFLFVLPLCCL